MTDEARRTHPPGDPSAGTAPVMNLADDFASLAAAYDSIPHLLFVIGPDDTYLGFRVGGGKQPHIPPSEFMGRHVQETLPADVAAGLVAALATARRERQIGLHAYALDTERGRHHYMARLVPTEGGRVVGLVLDVSEERARASALGESERRLRAIVENEPECVKVLTSDGKLAEMNRAGLGMLEAETLDEVRRKPLVEYVVPEHRAAFVDLSRRVFAGEGGVLEFEVVGLRGTRRWLETNAVPLRDEAGKVTALLGITRDVTERRAAAEAVRIGEARYRQIVETTHEGVWVIGTDDRTTFVNRRMGEILGYEPSEMIGRSVMEFVDEPERVTTARNLARRRQGASDSLTAAFLHRSGAVVWGHVAADPILDAAGAYAGSLALITDISAQRFEEEERARLWQVIDRSENEIFMFDLGTRRFVYANRGALRNLGYSLEEFRELTPLALNPARTESGLQDLLRPLITREQEVVRFRSAHRRKDGSTYPVDVHLELMEDSSGRHCVAFVEDVTERARAEEAMRASEARFRALTERATDIILLFDAPGSFQFVSPSISRLGYTPEDLVSGMTIFDLVHPEDADRAREFVRYVQQHPAETHRIVSRLRHKDGSWRMIDAVIQNLIATPAVGAIVANWRDITEQRLLEEQYRQAQKLESVGRLAGGIAHDFNNVLTAVVGFANLLQARVAGDPEAQAQVEGVLHAASRAGDLTRQLLAFARRQAVLPRPTQLNTVVEDTRRLLGPLLRDDVEVGTMLDPEAWAVLVDPSQIQQVILNLAMNARDAMPRGGRILVSTRNVATEAPELERLGLAGPHVLLEVRDTGVGIAPEILPHVFEPFFTTKPLGEGSGLGLATVYGIVSQLGGRIDVRSRVGEGTAVVVYFPRAEAPADAPRMTADAARPDRGSEAILLVEDDQLVRDLAAGVLRSAGYHVRTAATPLEAIEMAADPAERIDLLLTDEVMPGMSGGDLAHRLRADRPGLRVLRVSGYSESLSGATDGTGPGSAFLPKPYTPGALRHQVRRLLDETPA